MYIRVLHIQCNDWSHLLINNDGMEYKSVQSFLYTHIVLGLRVSFCYRVHVYIVFEWMNHTEWLILNVLFSMFLLLIGVWLYTNWSCVPGR